MNVSCKFIYSYACKANELTHRFTYLLGKNHFTFMGVCAYCEDHYHLVNPSFIENAEILTKEKYIKYKILL